jgi:hypothetical protein
MLYQNRRHTREVIAGQAVHHKKRQKAGKAGCMARTRVSVIFTRSRRRKQARLIKCNTVTELHSQIQNKRHDVKPRNLVRTTLAGTVLINKVRVVCTLGAQQSRMIMSAVALVACCGVCTRPQSLIALDIDNAIKPLVCRARVRQAL